MTPRLILLAVAAVSLSGCGRQGDLEQPAPLFGQRAKARYEAQRTADAQRETTRREADREDARAPVPNPTEGLRDAATSNVPASREPIQGTNDPVGPRPVTDPDRPR